MRALVSLSVNCGTNTGKDDCIWYNGTPAPVLLLLSFIMEPDLFHFVIHCLLLDVTNMQDSQRGT